MAFKFSLYSVLRLREHLATQAKNELGRVIAVKIQKLNILGSYDREIESLRSLLHITDLTFMQARFQRISYLEDEMAKIGQEIINIEEIESIKREMLSEAMRNEKTLEKLKEREESEYKYEMNKKEDEELSEIALRKYHYTDSEI